VTPALSPSIPLASTQATINSVATNAPISAIVSLLDISAKSVTSSNFLQPIHTTGNQGSTGLAIASITASVSGGSSLQGPTMVFNGFGNQSAFVTATANNITITGSVVDSYEGLSSHGYDGFYLQSTNTVSVPTSNLTSTAAKQTLTITPTPGSSKALDFFYDKDGPTGIPTGLTLSNFTLASVAATQVSGIYVLSGAPTYTLTTTVANMGNYFYRTPIVSYAFTPGSSTRQENTLSNVTGYPFSNIPSPLVISRTNITDISFPAGATGISVDVKAQNLVGECSSVRATLKAIVDPLSVLLIGTPTAYPNMAKTAVIGWRVRSGDPSAYVAYVGGTIQLPPLGTTIGPYLHTSDISQPAYSSELQVANGHYCTPASGDGYIAYSGYTYGVGVNSLDYSNLLFPANYRYATFFWRFNGITAPVNTTMYFTIDITNFTTPTESTTQLKDILNNEVYIYYMFLDTANNFPNAGSKDIRTSTWINASATPTVSSPVVSSTNFNTTTTSPNPSGNDLFF
jgi:hypothetical protein